MRALWRHVSYNLQEGGLRQVLAKVVFRIRQWLWAETDMLVYGAKAAAYQPEPGSRLQHRCLDFSALRKLRYFKALLFPEAIGDRLESGAVCHGFFLDSEIATIAWTTCGYLEIEPGVRAVDERSVGIYDCYTTPAHRSKGFYTESLIFLVHAFREHGVDSALIAVDPGNLASIKGIERAGFEPRYRLQCLRRFGRRTQVRSPFTQRYGWGLRG
jgi:GNAT superfamily N-acetyltransferase